MKIEAVSLKKDFEEMKVLKDVSVTLKDSEFVSVLGQSGCGKSTLFNVMAGLSLPDEGKVLLNGRDVTGECGHVSYMYQKDLLLPWYKIAHNAALPLILKGEKKKDAIKKAKSYFEVFGLSGFEEKYPFQLSGGMKSRAALLRTYLASKEIMLLDEPFGALDAITKRKMQLWLAEMLSKLSVSVLFITHDIEEAIFLSDRIYILTNRPSVVECEIKLPFPKPRDPDILQSPEFLKIKKEISDILNRMPKGPEVEE